MNRKLYMYISGGKTCFSTKKPHWNSHEGCYYHAKDSRVLSVDGTKVFKSIILVDDDKVIVELSENGFGYDFKQSTFIEKLTEDSKSGPVEEFKRRR